MEKLFEAQQMFLLPLLLYFIYFIFELKVSRFDPALHPDLERLFVAPLID